MYNKIDAISLELVCCHFFARKNHTYIPRQVDKLARTENTVVISCEMDLKCVDCFNSALAFLTRMSLTLSLDYLIERIWESLGLVKVYTKKRGERPDLSDPVCMRKGATIEVCISLSMPMGRCEFPHGFVIFRRMFVWESINHLQQISDTDSFGGFSLWYIDII